MSLALGRLNAAILGKLSNGTTFPTLTAMRMILIGDSISQNGNRSAQPVGAATYTRDAAGIITGGATGNGLVGTPMVYLFGQSDPTFEVVARNAFLTTSTLGSVGGGANGVAIYGPNLGAGTSTVGTNPSITDFGRLTHRASYSELQSRFKGGIEMLANLGRGGNVAPFTGEIGLISQFPTATFIQYQGGTNNAKALQNAATIFANVKTDLDAIRATGLPCMVKAIPPLGSASGGYISINAQINLANGLIAAECAAHPTQLIYSDNWTPLYDTVNQCMFTNLTIDGTHNNIAGSVLCGDADYTTLNSHVSVATTLSSSAADTGRSINGHTCLIAKGPWVGTTQASGHAGGSGTVPTGWEAGSSTANGTVVSSVFDPGDGLGWKVQNLCTATATGGKCAIWPWGAGGVTPATLGISKNDNAEYAFECELDWTGANASGVGLIALGMNCNGSFGNVTSGESLEAAGIVPDVMTSRVLRTGWLQMSDTGITVMIPNITLSFNAVTGSPLALNVRRVSILKR